MTKLGKNQRLILDCLTDEPFLHARQVAQALKLTPIQVWHSANALIDRGLVTRDHRTLAMTDRGRVILCMHATFSDEYVMQAKQAKEAEDKPLAARRGTDERARLRDERLTHHLSKKPTELLKLLAKQDPNKPLRITDIPGGTNRVWKSIDELVERGFARRANFSLTITQRGRAKLDA